MIEVELSDTDIEKATQLSEEMKVLRNSITKGEGNIAGFLGEIAALRVYGGEIAHTYDYDLLLPDGRKADVKTKRTTAVPLPHYDCSIAAYNTKQNCDVYIFTRVNIDEKKCWVLGHYDRDKYMEDARYLVKGQKDGDNWFTVKANCFNMTISELKEPVVA